MFHDLRHAIRSLTKSPGFTAAAVITLALGIGANTAVFSLINAILLKTLPLSAPEELYFVAHGESAEQSSTSSNYPFLERLRSRTDVFAGVTAYNMSTFKVSSGGATEIVSGQFVSGHYHSL